MRYITKYLQDRRIAVAGMTQTELVDAIYSEMEMCIRDSIWSPL